MDSICKGTGNKSSLQLGQFRGGSDRCKLKFLNQMTNFPRQSPTEDIPTTSHSVRVDDFLPIQHLFFDSNATLSLGTNTHDVAQYSEGFRVWRGKSFRDIFVYTAKNLMTMSVEQVSYDTPLDTYISAQILVHTSLRVGKLLNPTEDGGTI